ncbi:MAG: hypothetical protein M3R63_13150 [Actinomycetota bacterium]|nr:hypothetical protein [Actinomycetota bacterium]
MPLGSRTTKPAPSDQVEYCETPSTGRRIGIALSGGGIRSAAFNLGALQALQERKVLASADYLAAVSGGNYVASALTISQAYSDPGCENGKPLWAHGSPEERYLRRSTNYLAPGYTGRIWLALSVLYGFALNYLPFLLCAFIVGRLVGWLVSWHGLQLADLRLNGLAMPSSWIIRTLLLIIAVCLLIAVVLVAFRRFRDGHRGVSDYGESQSEPLAACLVTVAGLVVVVLLLPALAELYGTLSRLVLTRIFGEPTGTFDTPQGRIMIAVGWLLFMFVLAAAALLLSRLLRARRLMLVLSALAGGGLLLVPLLSSLEYSARQGVRSAADVIGLAVALTVALLIALTVHNRDYSMHLFYRERLNSAFALRRFRNDDRKIVAEPLNYAQRLTFSGIGEKLAGQEGVRLPKLIVCCAVNMTTGDVPVGRFAESFTFEHDRSGGPRFGYRETTHFEASHGPKRTELTLPSIMAMSGAALSPLMGRFTYPPLRFLMALTNVRLGVWIRNPKHECWAAEPEQPKGWIARIAAAIRDGWYEPGALYVLREALGGLNLKHRFIYLTDGGHWENLGLVELLRRRCTDVLCFDASSDQVGAGQDLGRAIALARSELGADIELDPRPTLRPAGGSSEDFAVRGVIRYPDQQEARLIYAKATLAAGASWDLLAFKARDGRFPNHATSQQIFTDEQFEAYRSLGHAAGRRAVELLNIPPAQLRSPGKLGVDATGNGRLSATADLV